MQEKRASFQPAPFAFLPNPENFPFGGTGGLNALPFDCVDINWEEVKSLRSTGELETKNSRGNTKLVEAIQAGDVKRVKLLLAAGANPNTFGSTGMSPLMYGFSKDHNGRNHLMEIRNLLIKAGANVNAYVGIRGNGFTALLRAVLMDDIEFAKLLLEAGANPNTPPIDYNNPLMLATQRENADMVRLLLEYRAEVDGGYDGFTALFRAAENGNAKIAKTLLAAGADANKTAKGGWTPLMNAAKFDRTEMVDLLLSAGANIKAKYVRSGKTAWDYAGPKVCTSIPQLNPRVIQTRG